jgi:hypothetical protein
LAINHPLLPWLADLVNYAHWLVLRSVNPSIISAHAAFIFALLLIDRIETNRHGRGVARPALDQIGGNAAIQYALVEA